jgi:hypothetical protein
MAAYDIVEERDVMFEGWAVTATGPDGQKR